MRDYMIRAVAFQSGERWVAQCLEYDLATQGRTLEELSHRLQLQISLQISVSLERGIEPFTGFQPAPKRFWDMYERAASLLGPMPVEAPEAVSAWPDVMMEARLAA